jgi:hypothetical protein
MESARSAASNSILNIKWHARGIDKKTHLKTEMNTSVHLCQSD